MDDIFVKIEGIPGESDDEKHGDWIEVRSYNHRLTQPASAARGRGGEKAAERCDHGDFTVTKSVDQSSPKLALACCTGSPLKQVKIELCRATGQKQKYMQYVMEDVVISSFESNADPDDNDLPVETVSFNYSKIEWVYTQTDHKTGKHKGDVKSQWDLKANRGR